jgi:hypothetical protein
MAEKTPALAFGPTPRAKPRISQAQADQLSAETADLGFGRVTSAPGAGAASSPPSTPLEAVPPAPEPRAPASRVSAPSKARSASASTRPKPAALAGSASLKFDVPGDLWTEMKVEAAKRRVTVKYLVLEALSKQGFDVDLEAVPEDGRRLR